MNIACEYVLLDIAIFGDLFQILQVRKGLHQALETRPLCLKLGIFMGYKPGGKGTSAQYLRNELKSESQTFMIVSRGNEASIKRGRYLGDRRV